MHILQNFSCIFVKVIYQRMPLILLYINFSIKNKAQELVQVLHKRTPPAHRLQLMTKLFTQSIICYKATSVCK